MKSSLEQIEQINNNLLNSLSLFMEGKEKINDSFGVIDNNVTICKTSSDDAQKASKEQMSVVYELGNWAKELNQLAGNLQNSTDSFQQ